MLALPGRAQLTAAPLLSQDPALPLSPQTLFIVREVPMAVEDLAAAAGASSS
jgi:hypothetical protein